MRASQTFPISDHGDAVRFFNPRRHINRFWLDVLRWKFTSQASAWPSTVTIPPSPGLPAAPTDGTITATWINHATVLIQTRHGTILIDPVFSDRTSPFSWAGPRRLHPPSIALHALPPIDIILLSRDHCDAQTLRHFAQSSRPPLVIPLGNGPLLADFGFSPDQIVELDWWDAPEVVPCFHFRATPARHWSNRLTGGRNHRLWYGFFIHAGGRTAYYTGDTAWDDEMFEQVRLQCEAPDLAIIPIGAYEPRWFMAAQHCNPSEAVRIHQTVGAARSIGAPFN